MSDSKRCPRCHESKPRSEFHKDSRLKDGLCTYCKECNKAKAKAWTKANPERVRERNRQRVQADEHRAYQGGGCAICGSAEAGRQDHRNLPVDHCHTSNRIRGLLCHSCNRAIGLLRDSPELLDKAAAYLRRFAMPTE